MKILIQNRSTMFTQRGGDTILVEQLFDGLRRKGVEAELDLTGSKDPADYDLVHLINFALPDMVRVLGERAKSAGTPFVVTTLCEDIPTFHNQSRALADLLVHYVNGGQSEEWYNSNIDSYKSVAPCAPFENQWTAQEAARLIVNGDAERKVIQKTYNTSTPISVVPVGYELQGAGAPELFIKEYGITDFIFCVGRLESRKNQLMLAKALEDVDIPLVFAGGGFSYQPEYAEAVKNFKRAGKTIVLDKLSPELLSAAYGAAKVHALSSWYELPGLVSLEAVMHGCNVVASETGTTRDYLGKYGFYCTPDNLDSIRNAVLAAYHSPFNEGAKGHIAQFSWDNATEKTIEAYEEVLGRKATSVTIPQQQEAPKSAAPQIVDPRFNQLAEEGLKAAQNKNFVEAHRLLEEAERLNPRAVRVLCNRAAVYLAEEKTDQAISFFSRALEVDPQDMKALSGKGMCLMMEQKKEEAYGYFCRALAIDPSEMVAILQLMDCSYALGRFDDLERILKNYLVANSDNFDMRYCYAGCLLKQGKFSDAEREVSTLFEQRPSHGGTQELADAIEKAKNEKPLVQKVQETSYQKPVQAFDSIDVRITELEDFKHKREYEAVENGCDELLARADISEKQREAAALLKAEVAALLGNRDEAHGVFQEYLNLNPQSVRALCGIAAVEASKENMEKAQSLFKQALDINPRYDKAIAGMGFCAFSLGQFEESWSYYANALEVNPENMSALLGVIQLGYQLGKLDGTQIYLESYLDMHPADLDMVYSYAGCLYGQNKLDEAQSEVEKILVFSPSDERAIELRDVISERLSGNAPSATP